MLLGWYLHGMGVHYRDTVPNVYKITMTTVITVLS